MGDLSDNFDREEFQCKCGCGQDTVDYELIKVLEDARKYFNRPISINSANRCEVHNRNVGGSPNSKHLISKAADIRIKSIPPSVVYAYFCEKYLDKYGMGCYTSFSHIDVRKEKARWGG